MEEIEIRPKDMKFIYRFSKYDCYKLYTGKCALDEPFDENPHQNLYDDCPPKEYCQSLYLYMKDNKVPNVEISRKKCDHHAITDGQHRICISKRKDIRLMAYYEEDALSECYDCYNKKKNIIYRIKSIFGKNDMFEG